mmetsp:Transcript_17150/g.27410  ORF Transcript_17150/g.27410 Transcript_17150/m.27410 type:complete len:836 (+) Transcript_17150:58-2565(+)
MSQDEAPWYTKVKTNDILDVKRDGEWRQAKVVSITESQFRCEFVQQIQGRTTREFIKKTSQRLAQGGTHVHTPVEAVNPAPAGGPAELVEGFGMTLNMGDKCDALDKNKYRSATVIEVNETHVKIHYEGWSAKWDEIVSRRSRKLQPRDSQTMGRFTGDPKRAQQQQQHISPDFYQPVVVDNTPKYWKRILSHGIGEAKTKKLDSIFEKACKMQDIQRDVVLGRNKDVDKLIKDMADFKKETAEFSKELPTPFKGFMEICNNIVSDIKSTLADTIKQKQRQKLISQDDDYFKRLHKSFYFVKIPNDGNCLFGASSRGAHFGKAFSECKHDGEIQDVVAKIRNLSQEKTAEMAMNKRIEAVMHLQTDPKYARSISAEVKHAIQTASAGGGNPTSKTLFAQMKAMFPGKDLLEAADTQQASAVYGQVLMTDKVFGTELEAQALSEVLETPLHIYYRVTNDYKTNKEIQATKIIGSQFEKKNPPVHLAFYMGKSHYDLLVKKHAQPDPAELKARAERVQRQKEQGFKKYKIVFTKVRGGEEEKVMALSQIQFFSRGHFTMPRAPINPRGDSPVEHGLSNLADADDSTTFMDLNFKKNGSTELLYEFNEPTIVTSYVVRYAATNNGVPPERQPTHWILYGQSEDGSEVLHEQKGLQGEEGVEPKGVEATVDFFPSPVLEEKSSPAGQGPAGEEEEGKKPKGEDGKDGEQESKAEKEGKEKVSQEEHVEPAAEDVKAKAAEEAAAAEAGGGKAMEIDAPAVEAKSSEGGGGGAPADPMDTVQDGEQVEPAVTPHEPGAAADVQPAAAEVVAQPEDAAAAEVPPGGPPAAFSREISSSNPD